jgi:hypothetical protein
MDVIKKRYDSIKTRIPLHSEREYVNGTHDSLPQIIHAVVEMKSKDLGWIRELVVVSMNGLV